VRLALGVVTGQHALCAASVTSTHTPRSFFNGLDAQHTVEGVTIDNLRLNGRPATSAADANLSTGQHVSEVRFRKATR